MSKVDYTIKMMRDKAGMTQEVFAEYFEIPVRTIQNWETESESHRTPPAYLLELMLYKLKNDKKI